MKLYIGNLPFSVGEQELREIFSEYTVTSAQLISDRDTGRSKGFGFVEMSDEDGSKAIEEFNGKDVGGRAIVVNEARPRENRDNRSFDRRR